MNDWIIFALLIISIIEIIFIIFRIKFNKYVWLPQKIGAIIIGCFIGFFHLFWITNNPIGGESFIFYWGRLIYEFYIICSIAIFFLINSLVSKLIDKFAESEVSE